MVPGVLAPSPHNPSGRLSCTSVPLSLRAALIPFPGGGHNIFEGAVGFPVESFLRQAGVGDELGRVAGASQSNSLRDVLAG